MNSDGSYSLNRERMFSVSTSKLSRFSSFIRAGAQASCAILPRNVNRPWGQCIGMTVHGSRAWALLNINRSIRSEAIVFDRLPAPKYRSAQLRRQRGAPHGGFGRFQSPHSQMIRYPILFTFTGVDLFVFRMIPHTLL